MRSETFEMRKQFLEEFYNEDRIRFLSACRNIYIKNDHLLNSMNERIFLFETEVVFSLEFINLFKTFCNLLKPFVYFLYSITYYKKFLQGKLLFFDKLEIRYGKDVINEDEMGNFVVHFNISNAIIPPDCENFNFLKSIKIKDFLNESVKGLIYLNMKIKTKYLNINRSQYRRLEGIENTISYVDMDDINNIEEAIDEMNENKIINSSQTFKSEECVICLTNHPNVLFCNCGHIAICSECRKIEEFNACPICKTENEIIRILEKY